MQGNLNINAKPFFPREILAEKEWYESKINEFIKNNKYIFEDEVNEDINNKLVIINILLKHE